MSAFAAAVGALFADPNIGRDTVYIADGGAPALVRILSRQADAITDVGDARIWSPPPDRPTRRRGSDPVSRRPH
ncbi:head-tail joining protein [Roseisalinus antarcticus]|uniref:head-tail joining protein n=1 Tax=Roseisalinus antarcticus TaxID=254357 RepID=UPI003F9DA782